MLVYDEVLTGCHRTGARFRCQAHGVSPDILVLGKALGNGFPVAAVAVREEVAIVPRMLVGSTFSNNALASAAVDATLACLERLDPATLVMAIERTVLHHLDWVREGARPRLRGCGAMWVITLDTAQQAERCVHALRMADVCVGFHGRQLRLLPSLTIGPERFDRACTHVARILRAHL